MVSVGMFEAKTRFSSLVADVVAGRTDCVRVMRRGVPVVRIVVDGGSRDASRRIGVRRDARRLPEGWWEKDKALDMEMAAQFDMAGSGDGGLGRASSSSSRTRGGGGRK